MASIIPQYQSDYSCEPDNELRRDKGKHHISSLMIWWFAKNEWSHPIFSELADWALNENGSVHPSQLSHIRNKKMRMMGLKVIDAFGAVNIAIYAYQQDKAQGRTGSDRLVSRLGTATITAQVESWIENATCIINPITGEPLDQGGFVMAYMGFIKIPGVINGAVQNNQDLEGLAKQVGKLLQQVITESGKTIWECGEIASSIYHDEVRARKFVAVATGLDSYTSIEIQRDITEICLLVSAITDTEVSPDRLVEKLVALA